MEAEATLFKEQQLTQTPPLVAQKQNKSELKDIGINLLSGSVSGIVGKTFEYPFDTVKVLQQTQEGKYSNALDCFIKTIRVKGFLSLYSGLSSPVVAAAVENATVFVAYGFIKNQMDLVDNEPLPLSKIIVAGGFCGIAVSCVLTPFELIKCRLQVQANALLLGGPEAAHFNLQYRGPIDVVRQTIKMDGVTGLFRGLSSTAFREIPGNAAWFGVYESICMLQLKEGEKKSSLSLQQIMFAGGLAGASYWSAFYPADTVKSKIQTDSSYSNSSFLRVFTQIFKKEGIRGLYKGWGITVSRAIPSNALIFATYENVSKNLTRTFNSGE